MKTPKIPNKEELLKIFYPEGYEEGKTINTEINRVPINKGLEITAFMKSMFKCERCGECCKRCPKKGIALTEADYN